MREVCRSIFRKPTHQVVGTELEWGAEEFEADSSVWLEHLPEGRRLAGWWSLKYFWGLV